MADDYVVLDKRLRETKAGRTCGTKEPRPRFGKDFRHLL